MNEMSDCSAFDPCQQLQRIGKARLWTSIIAQASSKETALKTTFRIVIAGALAAIPSLAAVGVTAHGQTVVPATRNTTAPAGQRISRTSDPKRQVSSLLARARRAIADANWETAEKLIEQAEAQNVKFGFLYFGDTPEKARYELDRRRQAALAPAPKLLARLSGHGPAPQAPPAGQVMRTNVQLPSQPISTVPPPVNQPPTPGARN
jgi:hypothetical protein